MKKILFIASIAIAFIILSFASCKKPDNGTIITPVVTPPAITWCAKCTESQTGVSSGTFCGTLEFVDKTIYDLKQLGSQYGQSWMCSKWKK